MFDFRLEMTSENRQAHADSARNRDRQDRLEMALMAHLGLWDAAAIARTYDTTRHSVYRAKKSFQVVPRG